MHTDTLSATVGIKSVEAAVSFKFDTVCLSVNKASFNFELIRAIQTTSYPFGSKQ